MFKLSNQEIARLIDIKWQAQKNLEEIPHLITFIDNTFPEFPLETERRFQRWVQSGRNSNKNNQ